MVVPPVSLHALVLIILSALLLFSLLEAVLAVPLGCLKLSWAPVSRQDVSGSKGYEMIKGRAL